LRRQRKVRAHFREILGDIGGPEKRRLTRDVAHQVGTFHIWDRAGLPHQLGSLDIARGNHAAHHA